MALCDLAFRNAEQRPLPGSLPIKFHPSISIPFLSTHYYYLCFLDQRRVTGRRRQRRTRYGFQGYVSTESNKRPENRILEKHGPIIWKNKTGCATWVLPRRRGNRKAGEHICCCGFYPRRTKWEKNAQWRSQLFGPGKLPGKNSLGTGNLGRGVEPLSG